MAKRKPEATETERFCPICSNSANSPHHIIPKSKGGTDDVRNIVWLCKSCHDTVEEQQEKLGKEFSPEFIRQMRKELHISSYSDIEESYIGNMLLWIRLPGKTKQIIEQYVGVIPENLITERTKSLPELKAPRLSKVKGVVGRPAISEIDTGYLEELMYNKGLSYREIKNQLKAEGFTISHEAVRKRIMKSPHYIPPTQSTCRYCNALFIPEKGRRVYCSPECNLAGRRHKKPIDSS